MAASACLQVGCHLHTRLGAAYLRMQADLALPECAQLGQSRQQQALAAAQLALGDASAECPGMPLQLWPGLANDPLTPESYLALCNHGLQAAEEGPMHSPYSHNAQLLRAEAPPTQTPADALRWACCCCCLMAQALRKRQIEEQPQF